MIGEICNVLAAMRGTYIDLYEWQRADVDKKRLPDHPHWINFAQSMGSMAFSGIELAHAVVKADFLIVRNLALPSLGFVLQMDRILEFGGTAGLRLRPGAPSILSDITQSSVVGRVGQGLSMLFAQERDYAFVGHLASDPAVIAHLPTSTHKKVADFLFEKMPSDRMILESKATFTLQQNDCSSVKTVLKQALKKQVDYWMGIVSPSPSKGYAVYSCLREEGGSTPSALVYVDPPERRGETEIELPAGWVRRHNYAAWLRAMGLMRAADRLRPDSGSLRLETGPSMVKFRIAKVRGREFAVLASPDQPRSFPNTRFAIGMDLKVLKMVSLTINGVENALLKYEPERVSGFEGGAPLSILSDGTLFGLVNVSDFERVEEIPL